MANSKSKIAPVVPSDEPPPVELHKLDPRSFAKQVEDAKKEAAPAPDILGQNNFEKCLQVARPDVDIEISDPWAEENVIASDDYLEATGPAALTKVRVGKPDRQHFIRVNPDKNMCRKIHLLKKKVDGMIMPDCPRRPNGFFLETRST